MSISKGMDKEVVIHIYNGILLSHKKNKIKPFLATWVEPEILTLSEVSLTKKTKTSYDITYTWNLKKIINSYKIEIKLHV